MSRPLPSISRLREMLRYEPETGRLFWRTSPTPRIKVGDEAGSRDASYFRVRVDGCEMWAHRVIFAMQVGRWPVAGVDHEDSDGLNNRWGNLREATQSCNNANSRLRKDNSLGLKGVSKHGRGFRATINKSGRQISIGTYSTPEAAHAAYVAKAKELFGEFARAA